MVWFSFLVAVPEEYHKLMDNMYGPIKRDDTRFGAGKFYLILLL